jgi:DNA mismatch endonuclease (patch repair protein)
MVIHIELFSARELCDNCLALSSQGMAPQLNESTNRIANRTRFVYLIFVRDRLSKERCAPRPSDARGIKGEDGKDRLSAERRSWNMSRIRGKNTTPEMRVRSLLHRLGFRFRLHVRISATLSASNGERAGVRCRVVRFVCPDIVLPRYKTVIFVHGCFWHRHKGCKNCTTPTNRRAWWLAKLSGNAARDKLHQRVLRKLGWRSIVVWECQTEHPKRLERLSRKLAKSL